MHVSLGLLDAVLKLIIQHINHLLLIKWCDEYACLNFGFNLFNSVQTLCNACGIDYMKQVTSRGSGITTFPDAVAVVPAANDDASPSAVPAEEGSDYSKGSSDV